MADWGVKVSKAGFDAANTADANLAFSSKFNSFKVFQSSLNGSPSQITLPAAEDLGFSGVFPGFAEMAINHTLGYQPSFLVWHKDSNGKWHFDNATGNCFSTSGGANPSCPFNYSDTTKLDIQGMNNTTSPITFQAHYAIMYDGA